MAVLLQENKFCIIGHSLSSLSVDAFHGRTQSLSEDYQGTEWSNVKAQHCDKVCFGLRISVTRKKSPNVYKSCPK